jgi:hypothetical protein
MNFGNMFHKIMLINKDKIIKVAAHKHYEHKAHTDALKVMREQGSRRETHLSMLTENLLAWSLY